MSNSHKTILHLCADMGSDSKYYTLNGYNVIRVGKDIGVENFEPPANVYGIIANPPCTHFSIARTVAKTPRDLGEGMRLVKECLRIIWTCIERQYEEPSRTMPLKFWALENPATGFLKWFLGKPTLVYSPFEYGDDYKKSTALWGNFNIPAKTPITCTKPKFDRLSTKEIHPEFYGKLTRTERRSLCSPAFSKAFYEANK